MKYKIIHIILACFISGIGIASCKTTKQVVEKDDKKSRPIFLKKLETNVQESYLDYNTLYIKFDAEVSDTGESRSIGGTLKIKRDSVMIISLKMAMIEVARASLTPDSIRVLIKPRNQYYACDYDMLSNIIDVDLDYYALEAILTNRMFSYPNKEDILDLKKNFKITNEKDAYMLTSHKERRVKRVEKKEMKDEKKEEKKEQKEERKEQKAVEKKHKKPEKDKKPKDTKDQKDKKERKDRPERTEDFVLQQIHISPDLFKIMKTFIHEYGSDRVINIEYGDFEEIDSKLFPKQISFMVRNASSQMNLDVKYGKVNVDKTKKFEFKLTEKYDRLDCFNESE